MIYDKNKQTNEANRITQNSTSTLTETLKQYKKHDAKTCI